MTINVRTFARQILKNPAYLALLGGLAFAQNQISKFFKQGLVRVRHFSLQVGLALNRRQLGKLAAREL